MFSKGSLNKESTPQRIYALLKLIKYYNGRYSREVLFDFIQPKGLSETQAEVKKTLKFCLAEKLIVEDYDKRIKLNFDEKFLTSESEFRKYINSRLYDDTKNNSFYSIARAILSTDLSIYDYKGFETLGVMLKTNDSHKDVVLAWRFWGAFLGYGFTLNSQFVINPYIRIRDIIIKEFSNQYDKEILIRDFINKLIEVSPDMKDCFNNNIVSLSISIALKTLNDLGIIELIYTRDSVDVWQFEFESTIESYTNIKFLGAEING